MHKRSRISSDVATLAANVVPEAAGVSEDDSSEDDSKLYDQKNPAAVELGRLGGRKGGRARAAKMSPEERSAAARRAAIARWSAKGEG